MTTEPVATTPLPTPAPGLTPDAKPPRRTSPARLSATLIALGLLLAGLVHGGNALTAEYVHDDHPTVLDNVNVTWPPPVTQIFTTPWFGPKRGFATQGLSRPLVTLSYALEAGLALESGGRHLVNLLLYGLVAGLVGLLVATLLYGKSEKLVSASAMVAVVLFAAHPLHTSSVLCVSYRPELLASAFALLATLAFLHAVRGSRRAGVSAVVLLLLALWSKESAVTVLAPWFIWAWLHRRALADPSEETSDPISATGEAATATSNGPQLAPWVWPVAATVVCGAWLAWRTTWLGTTPYVSAHDNPLAYVDFVPRMLGALWLVAYAGQKLLWPFDLAPDETFNALPVLSPSAGFVAIGGATVLTLGALAFWDLRRSGPHQGRLAVGIAWFAAGWLPVSHLLFPSTVLYADRLLFLPSIAWLSGVAWLLGRALVSARHLRVAGLALLLGLTLPWMSQSIAEGSHWRTGESLFLHGAEARPESLRMRYNLGQLRLDRGEAKAAVPDLAAAHAIDPSATAPWTLLVQAYTKLGQCKKTNTLMAEVSKLARQDDATRKAGVDADVLCKRYARAFAMGRGLRRVTVEWGRKVYVAGVAAGDPAAETWARRFHKSPSTSPPWVAAAVYGEQVTGRPANAVRRLHVLAKALPTMRAPIMGALQICANAKRRRDPALARACATWPGDREEALQRAATPLPDEKTATATP